MHDLGKTREFTYGAEIGLTDEGRLLGHIVLGQRLLDRYELPDDRRLALYHCVLTHHGAQQAPGGPVRQRRGAGALPPQRARRLRQGRARARATIGNREVARFSAGPSSSAATSSTPRSRAATSVTIYTRGQHGAAPDGVEHVIGDRADLTPLHGRSVGRRDRHLRLRPGAGAASAALDVGHYVFVSSCNAYPDWPDKPVDEDSPTWTDGEGYGPDKAAAERARAARTAPSCAPA